MSKNNNVNPGQYKVGGRERPSTLAEERVKAARTPTQGNRKPQKKGSRPKSR